MSVCVGGGAGGGGGAECWSPCFRSLTVSKFPDVVVLGQTSTRWNYSGSAEALIKKKVPSAEK